MISTLAQRVFSTLKADTEKTNIYGSQYLAEFYELRWAKDFGVEDVDQVYWPAFAEQYTSHKSDRPFIFLDIGTGGGRAILGLLKKVAKSLETSPSTVQFIGMDLSQHMLDQAAKEAQKYPGLAPVTWTQGSALALADLPPLVTQKTTVDFLMFTYGSICHLTLDGDLERFMAGIHRVLTSDTGRAFISFVDFLYIPRGQEMPKAEDLPSEPPAPIQRSEITSLQWSDIVYRMEPIQMSQSEHAYDQDMRVQVIKKLSEGAEEVIETNFVQHELRVFVEDHVRAAIQGAGLHLVDIKRVGEETIMVLQRPA